MRGFEESRSVGEEHIARMMRYVEQSVFRENSKGVFGRLVCERVAEKQVGRGSI